MKLPVLKSAICFALFLLSNYSAVSQVNEDQVGAWYMYFYDLPFDSNRFGVQGDIQFRNWDLGSDLEQLLLRSGLTYRPNGTNVKLTAGLGHITSGAFGESKDTKTEIRIYQEALLPHKITENLSLTHRFRYEQRFVEDQNYRTRFRYNLFLKAMIKNTDDGKGSVYATAYNELFINGQKNIRSGQSVAFFDRNRFYIALGYGLTPGVNLQLGVMRQTLDSMSKDQLQVSLHQKF